MRLFEFDDENIVANKILIAIDQLKQELKKTKTVPNWTLDKLLSYFEMFDVTLDPSDLYNMVKQKPLKDVIANIQGDKVIFKGSASSIETPQDQSQQVVSQMAKSAMGNK